MKVVLLLLICCGSTMALMNCCNGSDVLRVGGYCGDQGNDKIKLVCENGYFLVKNIVLKDNKLSTEDAPAMIIAEDPALFCLGEIYRSPSQASLGRLSAAVVCFEPKYKESDFYQLSGVLTLVSVVFLVFTFAVYMFLPQLRDLQGLCYMNLCLSMAFGFLFLGVLQLNTVFSDHMCTATGFLVYFWIIATFFWMNVICVNVYRHVNDAAYLKRTERKQYFIYNCYAWGCSIGFLIIALIANFAEGDHMKPNIGVNNCWFKERGETWLFFYGPIALILSVNCLLFVLSSYNLMQQTGKYEVSKINKLKFKFLLSLKLFLVMGISWIFEVASFAHGESHILWTIMDIFNCLQGVVIFLILVVLRRRAAKGLMEASCCAPAIKKFSEKLNPHDDTDDEQILADEHTEVRLN